MTKCGMLLPDTNTILRYLLKDEPGQYARAEAVFEAVRLGQKQAVILEGVVLECLYVIDYGVMEYRNELGDPLGYVRFFDYGTVIYAPGVGPVYSYERWMVEPGDPITTGLGDLTISLVETGVSGY